MKELHSCRATSTWALTSVAVGFLVVAVASADDKKPAYPSAASDVQNVAVIPPQWKKSDHKPLASRELDALLAKHLKADDLKPAPLTTDEQFIRRASLDLTGKLPTAEEVERFVRDKDPDKRRKLIDKLLESDAFNRRWAIYWREVMVAHATDPRVRRQSRVFDDWFASQLKEQKSWGEIAQAILTASGDIRFDGQESNGAVFFALLHIGNEADNERAAETSRVFMGIQISCAQCHDHPTDIWKRDQFHELAAFWTRARDRLIREEDRFVGTRLAGIPRGEHQMPAKDNPRRSTTKHPKFLTGESIRTGLSDEERRKALADFVTSKDNYWFSAAYVNRMWSVLMGQGFYMPVDNLGPLQDAIYPEVLFALASSFRATDYDIRELFRVIMNSEAYQRQSRLGDSPQEHLHFAGSYPTRLSADALWDALNKALGPLEGARPGGGGRPMGFGGRFSLQGMFRDAFEFDPSLRPDEVEGSIPQALILMNNPAIQGRIRATGDTTLARVLRATASDEEAVKSVYLHTLARKPTTKELETCLAYIKKVNNRNEAFEDILWSLINSTEFQTKR